MHSLNRLIPPHHFRNDRTLLFGYISIGTNVWMNSIDIHYTGNRKEECLKYMSPKTTAWFLLSVAKSLIHNQLNTTARPSADGPRLKPHAVC